MASCPSPAGPKLAAALLSCLLASMLTLASASEPPLVALSSLGSVEEGTPVRVSGLLVSLWRYDSGDESLVLADPADGSAVEVYCAQGRAASPGEYLHIGDEVLVEGEVSGSGPRPSVACSADGIELLERSEAALSVRSICLCWTLFEGDRFNTTGAVSDDGLMLEDPASGYGIPLRLAADVAPPCPGSVVRVDCTLFLDEHRMSIYLLAWSVLPA